MAARLTNMLLYLLLAAASLRQANGNAAHFKGRVLQDKIRHSSDTGPIELDVEATATYNSEFMALMNTACRPETDGYFGSTYGQPLTLEYGFKLETQPLASITEILDAVDDYVVDATLSNSFPQMCGYRRRQLARELGRASGFWFDKFEEVSEPCTPEISPVNFCGVFRGRLKVYGREQGDTVLEVLSMVDEVLNTNDPSSLHKDIVKIQSEDRLTVIPNYRSSGGEDNLSSVGKALILFAVIFVVSAVLWMFVARRKRSSLHSLHKSATMSTYSSNSRSKNTLYSRVFARQSKNKYKDYNPEERSIKPSMEPEAVAFGAGSRLLLTDGRPIEVEFDETNSSSTSVMDCHMEMSLDPRAEYI